MFSKFSIFSNIAGFQNYMPLLNHQASLKKLLKIEHQHAVL